MEFFVGIRHFVIFVHVVLPRFESFSSTESGGDVLFVLDGCGIGSKESEEEQLPGQKMKRATSDLREQK